MRAATFFRTGVAGLCLSLVVACGGDGNFGGSFSENGGFRSRYESARSALEAGNYDKANRIYGTLVEDAGPFEPRIRLEYAHSLLRGGDYAEASKQAQFLAQGMDGEERAAALSVYGTAEHELGLDAIQVGDPVSARAHFSAAQSALDSVLTAYPKLDPVGALATRRKDVGLRLGALGG